MNGRLRVDPLTSIVRRVLVALGLVRAPLRRQPVPVRVVPTRVTVRVRR